MSTRCGHVAPTRSILLSVALGAVALNGVPVNATAELPGGTVVPTLADPLDQPPPATIAPLQYDARGVQAPDRVVAPLWSRYYQRSEGERLRLVATLRLPIDPALEVTLEADPDTIRREAVAAAAHDFAESARALGATDLRALRNFPVVILDLDLDQLPGLSALPQVATVEEHTTAQWSRVEGAALMKADQLRAAYGGTGSGVGVAILDSGTYITHSEFAGRPYVYGNFTNVGAADNITDNVGHGTACAGIALGSQGGMAPQAKLWAFKVGDVGGVEDQWAYAALDTLYEYRNEYGGVKVVSMSFGSGLYPSDCDAAKPTYAQLISQLTNVGIAVVAAAGNDAEGAGVSAPSCVSSALSVGAVYDANIGPISFENCSDSSTAADKITCYSNSAPPLDLLAPSHNARTPAPGGGYNNTFGGTSAATPYVAGVIAQLRQLHTSSSLSSIRSALSSTGKPLTDVTGITRPRIEAVAAHQALGGGGGGGGTTPCVRNANTACLSGGRIEVKVNYSSVTGGSGAADLMYFSGVRAETDQSSFWWFFEPEWFEMGVKVIDACSLTGNFWVYISGLTNAGYTVYLRNTQTGQTRSYSNPEGLYPQTIGDTGGGLSCN